VNGGGSFAVELLIDDGFERGLRRGVLGACELHGEGADAGDKLAEFGVRNALMAQVFDRSSNALARASLVLTGLIVIALGVTLDQLQRSPWVTRQGQRPDQPIPFSHKHHVEGLGLQCQYCHTSVEKSSYAGIPPTKTCINCHAQIWTNAALLEPVRQSWATGAVDPVDQGA
jgi:hypothetical protein